MYLSYFFGRQSELLASQVVLKARGAIDEWAPLIEPVNQNVAALGRFGTAFGKAGARALIIINPDLHQLSEKDKSTAFRKDTLQWFTDYPSLVPVYRIKSGTTAASCAAFLKMYKGDSLALAYSSPGLSDAEIASLTAEPRIKFHIIVNDKITASQLAKVPKAKRVFIRDNFNKLARNADYGDSELFSDVHKTYADSGLGFGDFTVVGDVFQDSGSTPAAVATHAAYKHPKTGDVWMEHFVSDDKERGVGDVGAKFLQAAKKITNATKKRPSEFGRNGGLDSYAAHSKAGTYPGLGKNKEFQLVHHLSFHIDLLTRAI